MLFSDILLLHNYIHVITPTQRRNNFSWMSDICRAIEYMQLTTILIN